MHARGGRRKHPDVVAVFAFDNRFSKRPLLVQLSLFPELVGQEYLTSWVER